MLRPLEQAFEAAQAGLPGLLAALREAAQRLAGDEAWAGPAGRAAAELLAAAEPASAHGPEKLVSASLPPLLERLMSAVAVRPLMASTRESSSGG